MQKIKWLYGQDFDGFYWPSSDQKRTEINSVRRSAPAEFESVYQCRPGQREGAVFLADDIDVFFVPPPDLILGCLSSNVQSFLSKGTIVIQSWDTAASTSNQAAHTVGITALLVACNSYHCGEDASIVGECEHHYDAYILHCVRKKLDWGALNAVVKEQYQLFRPSEILIEEKSTGISLVQQLKGLGLPIIPTLPVESKKARAINSVSLKTAGSVQGWFRQHRVRVPDNNPDWYIPWRAEMRDFSGEDDSSSDQVDATVHLIRRAIQLGSSTAIFPSDWSPEASSGPAYASNPANFQSLRAADNPDPRLAVLTLIGELPSLTSDPYQGTCSRCVQFNQGKCSYHHHTVTPMDSCWNFLDREEESAQRQIDEERDFAQFRR